MDHFETPSNSNECYYCEVFPSTTTEWFNDTQLNATTLDNWEWPSLLVISLTTTVLGLMILATIIGNVFVIAAVCFEKNLQNSVANYLIVSLAVADLMVACLVMPLGALYEIAGNKWILGPILCDMWTSSDVLACTASILHLVAIAVDRFWAVTDIEYIRSRNRTRINTMISLVWLVAFIISLAPVLGWKDPQFYIRLETEKICLVSQDMSYQIFATCATFYVPLFVILILYWKIFQTARRRIRRRPGRLNEKCKSKKFIQTEEGSSRIVDGPSYINTTPESLQLENTSRPISRETTGDLSDELERSPSDLTPTNICDRKSHTVESNLDTEMADNIGINIERDESTADADIAAEPCQEENIEHSSPETSHANVEPCHLSPEPFYVNLEPVRTNPEPCHLDTNVNGRSQAIALTVTTPLTLSPTALLSPASAATTLVSSPSRQNLTIPCTARSTKRTKESIEAKRERKAAKTLAIITGAFVICWLPFFVMALTLAVCTSCYLPIQVERAFLWLGYFNSTLNPIIYTLFSPEFRQAFGRLLCGRRRYGRGRRRK